MAITTKPTPNGNETLLHLQNVGKSYGRPPKVFKAVQGVNIEIKVGEYVCLLGPSGCGKSTLLRIITGLNPATEGTVLYRAQPLQGVNPHATIVFQTFALYPWLTVEENADVALKARALEPVSRRQRA